MEINLGWEALGSILGRTETKQHCKAGDGSAGAEQSGCGLTWRLLISLFFPRTQEIEGFPGHAEPFVADENLRSGVSVTCQAAESGLSANSRSKLSVQMLKCPPCPGILKTSWEEEFAMELAGKHFGGEGVDCVMQGIAALSTPRAEPSDDTNQTGLLLLWSPLLLQSSLFIHSSFHRTCSCTPGCTQPSSLALG